MKTTRLSGDRGATGTIVTLLGVLVGISGAIHGFFEVLQGYSPTDGFFIFAVGKGNSWTIWTEGSEGAFTLVQNYLVTGVLAVIVGAVLAIWSVFFIKTKRGKPSFLVNRHLPILGRWRCCTGSLHSVDCGSYNAH